MASLKTRFEELLHLDWGDFIRLEEDDASTVDDVALCSLIRACSDSDDIAAIKLAFDRADGIQDTQIEIKVPKFYTRYPRAKEVEAGAKKIETSKGQEELEESKNSYDPASAKLRETLKEMRSMPKEVIRVIMLYKRRIEAGTEVETQPKVKAVIVANLLKHVKKGRFRAIELVFDQVDGKLPKGIKLLGGNDVFVDDNSALVAPAHAELDEHGVYYAENQAMTTSWLRGFARSQKGLEILAEGLDDE